SLWIIAAALLARAADPPPAAFVLEVKGAVTLERSSEAPRPLRRQDLLRPGDRVAVADGTALLVLLDDGHLESIPARAAVTVAARGCTPAEAVRRQEAKVSG